MQYYTQQSFGSFLALQFVVVIVVGVFIRISSAHSFAQPQIQHIAYTSSGEQNHLQLKLNKINKQTIERAREKKATTPKLSES